jgi:hypothetical protein
MCKNLQHNLSISYQFDLFDKLVKPILLYGCEIWGFGNNDILEKVHLKFCKIILYLKVTSRYQYLHARFSETVLGDKF